MKKMILAAALLITSSAFAITDEEFERQTTCRSIEWAELKDMPKDELRQMYCSYEKKERSALRFHSVISGIRGRDGPEVEQTKGKALKCRDELARVRRALAEPVDCGRP